MAELDQTSMQAYRKCNKCGGVKPLIEFYQYANKCKYCFREYYIQNRELKIAYQLEWNKRNYNKLLGYQSEYTQSGKRSITENQHYHELQDKYSNHHSVWDWYPGARLIEALETATIVEIKA